MFYTRKKEHTQQDREMLEIFLEKLKQQIWVCRNRNEEVFQAYHTAKQALSSDTFEVIEDADTNTMAVYVPGLPSELMESWYYNKKVCL